MSASAIQEKQRKKNKKRRQRRAFSAIFLCFPLFVLPYTVRAKALMMPKAIRARQKLPSPSSTIYIPLLYFLRKERKRKMDFNFLRNWVSCRLENNIRGELTRYMINVSHNFAFFVYECWELCYTAPDWKVTRGFPRDIWLGVGINTWQENIVFVLVVVVVEREFDEFSQWFVLSRVF